MRRRAPGATQTSRWVNFRERTWVNFRERQSDLVSTVTKAVNGGCAHQFIGEGGTPFIKCEVAGHQRRLLLIALSDQFVEIFVLGGTHGTQAEVVDRDHINLGELLKFALVGIDRLGRV